MKDQFVRPRVDKTSQEEFERPAGLNVVTGAFGYTGRYITRELLSRGQRVVTLTGHPSAKNPFGDKVGVVPFAFDNQDKLVRRLQGVDVLFNTYWVRFPYGRASYDEAIENTIALIEAAEEAGVRRFVHLSVSNASPDSPLPYFRGKGILERAIMNSKLSYAIIRPTLIFGEGDVLINNIAWMLRRFPVFGIPGDGSYRLQPIYVEDLAGLAARLAETRQNTIVDAVGPETYTFDVLVRLVAAAVQSKARIIHCRTGLALLCSSLVGRIVKDVVLTKDEVDGLMANLLVSDGSPAGQTRFSDWVVRIGDTLGRTYASELDRHFRSGGRMA